MRTLRSAALGAAFAAFATLATFATGTAAGAHETRLGPLQIGHAWARATAGKAGAAYLEIRNGGGQPDKLVSAASPAAATVELHTHIRDGDVMRMRKVPAIDLAPGKEVKLAPGGLHVMLIGLKAPLKAGDRFPLTLTFDKAGSVTLEVEVQPVAASAPPAHQHHHQHRH
ncbi:MAG: copper chaperone PCu(A)C [Alphaproteobacteria bacterium]|nr:copper chaperone PCu(A)C [Alphaproteobacteria bacterium]